MLEDGQVEDEVVEDDDDDNYENYDDDSDKEKDESMEATMVESIMQLEAEKKRKRGNLDPAPDIDTPISRRLRAQSQAISYETVTMFEEMARTRISELERQIDKLLNER
ncbi:hypothetical protein BGZ74_006057, partial [Mortierella antarctica]